MPALSVSLLKKGNHPLENAFSEVTYCCWEEELFITWKEKSISHALHSILCVWFSYPFERGEQYSPENIR